MIEDLKDKLIKLLSNRALYLIPVFIIFAIILTVRLFDLQIVHGQEYLDNFILEQKKTKDVSAKRGSIYDRNGNLLAYDDLAYSINIEDTFESGRTKSPKLNAEIRELIRLIEKNGDQIDSDFGIIINEDNEFEFAYSDTSLLRFKADIYGHAKIADLEPEEKEATAEDIIRYLSSDSYFSIGEYEEPDNRDSEFIAGLGYSMEEWLKTVIIRYNMSLTAFRKYLGTTVSTDISQETIAVICENSDILPGVTIEESTVRRYVDSIYFSHLCGYTGKISSEELEDYNESLETSDSEFRYNRRSVVGKIGIEKTMEEYLRGESGSQTLMVNSTGKTLAVLSEKSPRTGNDVYLTIDKDLTIVTYKLLEQKLAGILAANIVNTKTYDPDPESSTNDIIIPIYDVYYAFIDNSIIDIKHFEAEDASEEEKLILELHEEYKETAIDKISNELLYGNTPYKKLSKELKNYEDEITIQLRKDGIYLTSLIDSNDPTQIAWYSEESISLSEYLMYCIDAGWIDIDKLKIEDKYSDSEEIYKKLVEYILERISYCTSMNKLFYKYMLLNDTIKPDLICKIICNQGCINVPDTDREKLFNGKISAYAFCLNRINNIDVTPAQLALDPCNASCVVTDVNNGDVLAVVTYPGYDNNKMANSVDPAYYSKLLNDNSSPLYNFATQYKGAPGSTFKLVSSTAALMENIVKPSTNIFCSGTFTSIDPSPKCWRLWGHGNENLQSAIKDSCNCYFYDVGYKLSINSGKYDVDQGISIFAKYADMYGLTEKTGVEMPEEVSKVSDMDPVRTAIGQATNAYTTIALARYTAALANRGTVFKLTLLKSVNDSNNNVLFTNNAEIRNTVDLDDSEWDVLQSGMRAVVTSKKYYNSCPVSVAGKTGTAQQSNLRPTHAVFIGYAPYENPEIAVATRICFGYSSDYPAQVTRDVISYYYDNSYSDLIDGTSDSAESGVVRRD